VSTVTRPDAVPEVAAETIDVAGSPVAVRRRGPVGSDVGAAAVGDPVLFLHGAGFTGAWLRFHEALAQGADVIAPEHIGYGGTPMQDWLDDIGDLVLHYDDVRRTLGLERFHLVGYSLGGWVAAAYATLFPERLRSLTLITPAGIQVPGKPPFADLFTMTPEQLFGTIFNDPRASNTPQMVKTE